MITFWRPTDPNGYLGQWYESDFYLDDEIIANLPIEIIQSALYQERYDVIETLSQVNKFENAEKFMMIGKAALFYDGYIIEKMSEIDNPLILKRLGRQVKHFVDDIWAEYNLDIVTLGNYLKFTQNKVLKKKLLKTKGTLVEGSPMDRLWGVGLKFDNPAIYSKTNWRGKNLLGLCLMRVRSIISDN